MIGIVTDSACDLPEEVCHQHNIEVVPLSIRFGSDEFVDRKELSTSAFWERCATFPGLPETAAPSPGRFEAAFRSLAARGATGIVCVNLSSELSGTMQSARLAADAVSAEIPVEVVDSRSATVGLGSLALSAAQLAATGAPLAAVADHARALVPRTRVVGALDTLENLKKGGRIGNAKALLASVLSIKPIIEVRDGKVEEAGRQRTRAKALAYLVQRVRTSPSVEDLAVMHAQAPDVDAFVDQLRAVYTGDILVGEIGAVIGTHTGRGTIGVVFRAP